MARNPQILKELCHEVLVYDMFGKSCRLSISCFTKCLRHPQGLFFIVLTVFLLFTTDPTHLRTSVGTLTSLVVFCGGIALYLTIIFANLAILSVVTKNLGQLYIWTPITSGLSIFATYWAVTATLTFATNGAHNSAIYPYFFDLMGAVFIIELLFMRYVMPGILDDGKAQIAPSALITINDRQFPTANLRHILSQEHYLQVTTVLDQQTIRARLSDVVLQTTPEQGLQPHRSWWVSKTAEPKMEKTNGRSALKLNDGTTVPIAKARVATVQRWLDLHCS